MCPHSDPAFGGPDVSFREQDGYVGWQRQGLGSGQAEIHDDPMCTAPSLGVAPSMDLAVLLQWRLRKARHTLQDWAVTGATAIFFNSGTRVKCRAVTFCELVQVLVARPNGHVPW